MQLQPRFIDNITGVYGDAGRAWLNDLAALLAACERRWRLTLGEPYELSYNYVAPASRANGERLVLKAGPPHPDRLHEIAALRACDGQGMVRLIDFDASLSVMLLERLEPGTMLAEVADDRHRTEIAADMMLRLARTPPADHAFPTISEWAQALPRARSRFHGGTGPIPGPLFARAEELWPALIASAEPNALLHGDLHHENILRARREPWLAIDPHGVIGDRGFEVGSFLRNHLLELPEPARALADRVDVLSARLGIDRDRVVTWGIAVCVLSACWSTEDISGFAKTDYSSGMHHAITTGELLLAMSG
jgi:streptomycin 6-kinase